MRCRRNTIERGAPDGVTLGLVVESGPLDPGRAATYALYAIALLWLITTTTVMVFGMNRTPDPN